jgi:DNA repair protein RadC
MKESLDYLGHRSRVRKKFLTSSGDELQEYELLEILLFAANPRKDTKSLAKKLITKFGDISSVVNAEIDMLRNIDGVGEAAITQIKITAKILQRILKNQAKSRILLNDLRLVIDYARSSIKDLSYEVFKVLFLDKKHQLLEDELVVRGENDHVFFSSRAIAKKALLLSASSLVLIHNHPSGELKASKSDIVATNEVISVLKGLEIRVLDHLIISSEGHFSFKENGLI